MPVTKNAADPSKQDCVGLDYDTYLAERNTLIEQEFDLAQKLDQYLVGLAGGAFGLSIAFVQQIAPAPVAGSTDWICAAWVSFVVSLIATVVSLWTGQRAYRQARDILDDMLSDDMEPPRNWWSIATNVLNLIGLIAFVVGALLLAHFAALNMESGGPQ